MIYNLVFLTLLMFRVQQPEREISFPARPPLGTYVVDEAQLLAGHSQTIRAINELAADQVRLRNFPTYVVTIPSLASRAATGQTIEEYARALFDAWKIGSADHNYGMLLLVSRADRQARIELGASWGHSRDDDAGRVLDDLVIPEFRNGRFHEGILAAVRGMRSIADGTAAPAKPAPLWLLSLMAIGFALAGTTIFSLVKSGRDGWGWALFGLLVVGVMRILAVLLTPRKGSDDDGDAPEYGGGSSGGGGATGRW